MNSFRIFDHGNATAVAACTLIHFLDYLWAYKSIHIHIYIIYTSITNAVYCQNNFHHTAVWKIALECKYYVNRIVVAERENDDEKKNDKKGFGPYELYCFMCWSVKLLDIGFFYNLKHISLVMYWYSEIYFEPTVSARHNVTIRRDNVDRLLTVYIIYIYIKLYNVLYAYEYMTS